MDGHGPLVRRRRLLLRIQTGEIKRVQTINLLAGRLRTVKKMSSKKKSRPTRNLFGKQRLLVLLYSGTCLPPTFFIRPRRLQTHLFLARFFRSLRPPTSFWPAIRFQHLKLQSPGPSTALKTDSPSLHLRPVSANTSCSYACPPETNLGI